MTGDKTEREGGHHLSLHPDRWVAPDVKVAFRIFKKCVYALTQALSSCAGNFAQP